MWNPGFGWGFGHGLFSLFGNIIAGLAFILCVSVTIAVLFLLVRFLLIGTRAAQLYVDKNGVDKNGVDKNGVENHSVDKNGVDRNDVDRNYPKPPSAAATASQPTASDAGQTTSATPEQAKSVPSGTTGDETDMPAPKSAAMAAADKRPSARTTKPKSPPAS